MARSLTAGFDPVTLDLMVEALLGMKATLSQEGRAEDPALVDAREVA
jgi:hypothetical protein